MSHTTILAVLYAFLWGVRKGSIVCLGICAPAFVLKYADKSNKPPVVACLEFNLPRIFSLTIAGMIVGALSYTTAYYTKLLSFRFASLTAYAILAIFFILYGAYMLAKSLNTENCVEHRMELPKIAKFLANIIKKVSGNHFFIFSGTILAFVCLGETFLMIELAAITGAATITSKNIWTAISIGAAIMMAFALGTTLPVSIAIFGFSRLKNYAALLHKIKLITSILMMSIGIFLMFYVITSVSLVVSTL